MWSLRTGASIGSSGLRPSLPSSANSTRSFGGIGERNRRVAQVRKNSSGYALDRFLPEADAVQLVIGSEGTIAVVTSVTLTLAPVPEAQAVALIPVRNLLDLRFCLSGLVTMKRPPVNSSGRRFLEVASLTDRTFAAAGRRRGRGRSAPELDGDPDSVFKGAESLRHLARELGLKTHWAWMKMIGRSCGACAIPLALRSPSLPGPDSFPLKSSRTLWCHPRPSAPTSQDWMRFCTRPIRTL